MKRLLLLLASGFWLLNSALAQQISLQGPINNIQGNNPTLTMMRFDPNRNQTGNQTEWRSRLSVLSTSVDLDGNLVFGSAGSLTLPNGVILSGNGSNAWDGIKFTKSVTSGPTVGTEAVNSLFEINRTSISADQATISGIEAVARSRSPGVNLTIRGGHFRTYVDDTLGGTAVTSVGIDGSARASGAVVAAPGTAFVGIRSYMAPGFTAPTLANVTNFHAFWAYNESATQAVTNAYYASAAAGGFTNGLNFSGTTLTNEATFSNSMTLSKSGANAWDGLTLTKATATGPTVGNEGVGFFVQNNRTDAIADQATVTGIEAVTRSRSAGTNLTIRGGHFRTYVDDTLGGTAITSVGIDGSARASGAVVATPGTAFVGVRSYMAPGFTGGTLANVTNFHAFWAYNESATQAVTNVLYSSDAGGGFTNGLNFTGTQLTNEAIFSNGMTLAGSGANAWDGLTITKTTATGPTVGNEGVGLFIQNNRTAAIADQATVTGIEAVTRSRASGVNLTIRGGHFRTYVDDTLGGTAITSVGIDGSARASGAVVAAPGTAFVGVRSYMAPGFTGGTLANVTNHHAFWAYNESATQAVTNAYYASSAAGGFTNGLNLSGATIAAGGGQVILSNGVVFYTGAQVTRDNVRAEVGLAGAIGSKYFSTGGREYLKVANANATGDWERVTTSAAD